ncbi:unnamed product [Ostreococcus tauri]|uniref:Unnamed product n=1 Tax=Ostreococcus tauri TaxID=70448 RepID=A0A090LZL9_OSTTA|nr:unnamed product [Ostreococcus tauri]CEF97440.1 unnamed product [Ostreococcus tauri]|eukprot:XP_003078596.2 unnamed product [Ostreococcus tauri]
MSALAIFHPSSPSALIGTAANAIAVPSVVPTVPKANDGNRLADPLSTLLTSAVSNNIGTANGNKNPFTTSYVGDAVGITPTFAATSAHSVETRGAPPNAAPHGFFSAHNPIAEHAKTPVHVPSASAGAMSARATVAGARTFAPRLPSARVEDARDARASPTRPRFAARARARMPRPSALSTRRVDADAARTDEERCQASLLDAEMSSVQPAASQARVFVGVAVGLAIAAIPFAFKEVRGRERAVADARDRAYEGRDDARNARLSAKKR